MQAEAGFAAGIEGGALVRRRSLAQLAEKEARLEGKARAAEQIQARAQGAQAAAEAVRREREAAREAERAAALARAQEQLKAKAEDTEVCFAGTAFPILEPVHAPQHGHQQHARAREAALHARLCCSAKCAAPAQV